MRLIRLQWMISKLFWVEFLPYIDPAGEVWEMYENEYQFVTELSYAYICHINVETQASATILGIGKEAVSLVQ